MHATLKSLLSISLLLPSAFLLGQRNLKDIPDPSVELERKSFQVHEDFEVNLFAADPIIAKPIQMNWDRKGRLWIASSSTYPQIKPGEKASDKILVLEDTDRDGKADKTTVFKDGLLIPTGVVPADGGAYVANSTEILFLEDTDNDGKADKETVVLSGFGTEDTHHIIHTLRGGHDGAIYFNQSIYIHSHVETPWGVRRLGGGGIWQFRPETRRLEIVSRGMINPWGHIINPWGQSFATDGAFGEGINYVFPGAVFKTAPNAKRVIRGLNPGQPKQCGLEILSGRHLPEEWQDVLVTNDFRGHRVNTFKLIEEGSGYISQQGPNLITTNHAAFRPIDVRMGPDGAIYIADWYNPIIQHGEVDFRDHRRDHVHGRIWRITAKGRKPLPYPKIHKASIPALLEHLKSPEYWTRHFAKRELRERDSKVVRSALDKWLNNLNVNDALYERHRLEAFWTMHSLNILHTPLFKKFLKSDNHRARAAAIRMIYERHSEIKDSQAILEQAITDPNQQVRLEAVNALRKLGTSKALGTALKALDMPVDKKMDFALWTTVRDLEPTWFPAYEKGELKFATNQLTFALKATENPNGVNPLINLLKSGKLSKAEERDTLTLISEAGSPQHLNHLLDKVLDTSTANVDKVFLLQQLDHAAQTRNIKPSTKPERLITLMESGPESLRANAAQIVGKWQINAARKPLEKLARNEKTARALRQAALTGIASIGGPDSLKILRELGTPANPLPTRAMAAAAMVNLAATAASTLAADLLGQIEIASDASPIFDAFFQKSTGPRYLARALNGKQLSPEVAILGIRKAAGTGKRGDELIKVLTSAAGLKPMAQQLSPTAMNALIKKVRSFGNPARGETVYRRQALACLNCHAIGGGGPVIGPDLVSLGASAPVDYIIESLLNPGKKIKEGYHLTTVTTKAGQVYSGALIRRDDKTIVLRDATGKTTTLPLSGSPRIEILNASLMPPGLTASLREDEFVDLVRFLSELGKDGAYKIGPNPTVRTWQILQKTTDYRKLKANSLQVIRSLEGLDWEPGYSKVSGELPIDELPTNLRFDFEFSMASFKVEVTTGGKVTFKLNDPTGLQMWFGDKNANLGTNFTMDLDQGIHQVLVAINPKTRKTPLQLQLVPGETGGQAKILGSGSP
jgi:putative heme-binding domain-containing protein